MPNISHFNNTADYLPLLNAVIITDLIVIGLLLLGAFKSQNLRKWYKDLQLSAVLADILISLIGIILARYFYPLIFKEYSLIKFILLAVGIQITHDILFYLFFSSIKRGKSLIIDIFKDYGREMGFNAIISDSLMIISSVLIATFLKGFSINANIIVLILSIYLIPYFIFSL